MNEIFTIIKKSQLFKSISFSDFEQMVACISAKVSNFKKGDIISLSGASANFVGLVLSGSVKIIRQDISGNNSILAKIGVTDLFGEVFACAGIEQTLVTVQAAEDTSILFVNYKKIITTCSAACPFHKKLIENMLRLIALKNLLLNDKLEILSKRTTREKIICFLNMQRGKDKKFAIPFNREEMAEYLCVDRSALSNQLCKLRDEGVICFEKNEFEFL